MQDLTPNVFPTRSLLVFVYRKADAARLAKTLGEELANPDVVRYFHAGLPREARNARAAAYRQREVRVLVTTTSLKMGVNSPATDVVVRDTVFHGSGRLPLSDILQMIGRAGRGDTPGQSWVLCESEDPARGYGEGLAEGRIERLEPQLVRAPASGRWGAPRKEEGGADPLRDLLLSEFAVRKQASLSAVDSFLQRTYTASRGYLRVGGLGDHAAYLEREKLVFRAEGTDDHYGVTKLGRTVTFAGICPESGALLGGFLRAMIRLDEKRGDVDYERPRYLARLTGLDFLVLALSAHETRDLWLEKPSKKALADVQEYVESLPPEEKPVVNLWRSEDSREHPTRRLLSTLRIPPGDKPELVFYRILRTAVMLYRHARGKKLVDLAAEYGVDEGWLESSVKPTVTWVLSCLAQICDSRKCYKLDAHKMRILELMEDLTLGATLGKLLQIDGVGRRTVETLLDAGHSNVESLVRLRLEDFVELGVPPAKAKSLITFVRRRSR